MPRFSAAGGRHCRSANLRRTVRQTYLQGGLMSVPAEFSEARKAIHATRRCCMDG